MKNYKKTIIAIILTLMVSGCGVGTVQNKTEFLVGEQASIDGYEIMITNYEELNLYNGNNSQYGINGRFIKVNYILTNNTTSQASIAVKKYFKLVDENGIELNPISEVNDYQLSKNETVSNEVIFDTKLQDKYKIIFYSNIVTNNIAFYLYRS